MLYSPVNQTLWWHFQCPDAIPMSASIRLFILHPPPFWRRKGKRYKWYLPFIPSQELTGVTGGHHKTGSIGIIARNNLVITRTWLHGGSSLSSVRWDLPSFTLFPIYWESLKHHLFYWESVLNRFFPYIVFSTTTMYLYKCDPSL